MNFDSIIPVAVAVFVGLLTFSVASAIWRWALRTYNYTFDEHDKAQIIRRLKFCSIWYAISLVLTLDLRNQTDGLQYIAIGLASVSVLIAMTYLKLDSQNRYALRAKDFQPAYGVSQEEYRRSSMAEDAINFLWISIALIAGGFNAVTVARLIAFKAEGHWFWWFLS